MELHNKGWSNKEIVTFLNLNKIQRRNKNYEYSIKDVFMCIKKSKLREDRKKDIKYKLDMWTICRESD